MSLTGFLLFMGVGLAFVVVVTGPFLIIYAASDWWFNGRKPPTTIVTRKPTTTTITRKCMSCGAGYDASWDPPDFTPRKARQDRTWMSGGLCPNCSGAD
jgi:hypothetical protein